MENPRNYQSSLNSSAGLIKLEKHGNGIAIITINRPEALNALTKAMFIDFATLIKALDADRDVKVIILTGAGRAFCSGVDLTAAQDIFKGDVKNKEIDPVIQMEECSKPIIGAINGFAVTAGFEIALTCDILVASKDAKFVDTHCKFGIFPSWGLSQKLPRIIGVNRAKELSLTGKALDAATAERWGLVNKVVESKEVLKAAIAIAEEIVQNQQDMVVHYKRIINDGFRLSFGDGAALEKERAHKFYENMTSESFKSMQKYIASRASTNRQSTSKL
ncbi:hypothetical protein KP509_24G003200 [Ceratopteris richardii]|uniref:Enoyl-CoA hydratase n=2 Tax=Ceratopteris richardii TaxID=49495 RepID=A0A8T2RS74_CERRI|nr:hypothetical protein KP509_24G003200 [Ceratopteris richardii]KAH7299272.1 hypothetical protein KP509_24G003200 [Ceratopteris richardii]KAH7299273.1 hypothetical protein KP509_24G003200 [Ceratopteris richardii]